MKTLLNYFAISYRIAKRKALPDDKEFLSALSKFYQITKETYLKQNKIFYA